MPQQIATAVENNFTKGLITESTGLNFPENAATSTSNCEFTLIGDTLRRLGIDFEQNYTNTPIDRTNLAMASFIWNNPGSVPTARIFVRQIGSNLHFWDIAAATLSNPLSSQYLGNVSLLAFASTTFNTADECQFAVGNGFLFVYQSTLNPVYCVYNQGTITASVISMQIRDFAGDLDGLATSFRPTTLSVTHQYNLLNQGWITGSPWGAGAHDTITPSNGLKSFTIGVITGPVAGQLVRIEGTDVFGNNAAFMSGTVVGYVGSVLTVNVTSFGTNGPPYPLSNWTISPTSVGYLTSFLAAAGVYPSNSDVWWYFKNAAGAFDPGTTLANVTLSTGTAPQGHFLMSPFNQDRNSVANLTGITVVSTTTRPTTGCWFQGRVWYSGVNAFQTASSNTDHYSWSNRIYFSSTVVTPKDFGICYQTNDPTSETLNGELPTDGGEILIAEAGTIHKLFPIANGLLVFADNGVWFITGSQGIGFAANDYTITKISSVRVLTAKSFVDVMGLPLFWNEEGIYQVKASQNGALAVEPLTVGTILTFYNTIPLASKKYARGDYDPINYVVQWSYRSTQETDVTSRYQFDSILNFNTYNKAFFPYSVATGTQQQYIHDIKYVAYPSITSTTPEPSLMYPSSFFDTAWEQQFSLEFDDNYVDWGQTSPTNYISYFVTGYKIRGQAIRRFQPQYIQVFNRTNNLPYAYKIQGVWDYSNDPDSGRWSTVQMVTSNRVKADVAFRRHKIRGHGLTLQFKIQSVDGLPFDVLGWSIIDTVNQSA